MKRSNPLAQALGLIENILSEVEGLSQPRVKFMRWIFGAWLGLPVRHTISNLARFGPYCEKSIRLHMAKSFPFASVGQQLIARFCGGERIAAFDPSYLSKSGRHTYGVDSWWCGSAQRMLKGLELGILGVIDVKARTAFSLRATQTPSHHELKQQGKNLMSHYVGLIEEQAPLLRQLKVRLIAADAYFAKKSWIEPLRAMGFEVVTRLRSDANLNYLYHGPQAPTGRPRKYAGKVNCRKIDKRRLSRFASDDKAHYYSGVVYAVGLGCRVRIVYIEQIRTKGKGYSIVMSSDTELAPEKIVEYYKLRFQIEFLIRDAKSYAGLEEAQARDKEKLDFHFNMALTSVSWAKAAFWMTQPACDTSPDTSLHRGAFSMRNCQLLFLNGLCTHRVFQNLALDLSLEKHRHAYHQCLNIGNWAV